jgi:hypothetical protein
MKTVEQIKKEVITYLQKSSGHLFMIDQEEHKILLHDKYCISITGDIIRINDIDKTIEWYNANSKSVISDMLFLIPRYYNKEIKSIPYYKAAREKYNDILKSLEGVSDIKEIKEVIKNKLK